MKAKQVNEFKQGGDPYKIAGLGKHSKEWIDNWFKTFYNDSLIKYDIINGDIMIENLFTLEWSIAEEMPDNLNINHNVYLANSKIKKLPSNLYVQGDLMIYRSLITELPKDLIVNGIVYVHKDNHIIGDNFPSQEHLLDKANWPFGVNEVN
jgi:hypothetical protein